jgi:hypothetical protein
VTLADLLYEANLLGLRRLTWTATADGWTCTTASLRVPHLAAGATPIDALQELIRFAWRVC